MPSKDHLSDLIDQEILNRRAPTDIPPFKVSDIRRAIPEHCFQRSLLHSVAYLTWDLAIVVTCFFVTNYLDAKITEEVFGNSAFIFRSALWIAYWIVNGTVGTGLWVLGHECGHGGFSPWESVNDAFGLVIHSFLLVPYFSWKISHRRHHSNTGNLDRDEVFVPRVRESTWEDQTHDDSVVGVVEDSIFRLFHIFIMLTIGWPLYLFFNTTGHQSYPKNTWVNHFAPSSPIFTTQKERWQVVISDLALIVVVSIFSYVSYLYSFGWFFKVFGMPYLIVNLFLVLITFLQHTDYNLPHYSGSEWDWLRGALATVDRDFGILNRVFHHITDTHVVHHLFSSMPFYHAQEATEAVKPLLGAYYKFDDTHFVKALWNNFICDVAQPDVGSNKNGTNGIHWFRPRTYRSQKAKIF